MKDLSLLLLMPKILEAYPLEVDRYIEDIVIVSALYILVFRYINIVSLITDK